MSEQSELIERLLIDCDPRTGDEWPDYHGRVKPLMQQAAADIKRLSASRALLGQCERILEWMSGKQQPVLLSDMKREMGSRFNQEAFDSLVLEGTIRAAFPEAKPGDSGRQFWNFAHTAQP